MRFWDVIVFLGPPAAIAMLASACVGLALQLGRNSIQRFTPAAQARLLLTTALAPAFAAAVFFSGGSSDWLLHGPADFCLARVQCGLVSGLLIACSAFVTSRVALGGLQLVREVWRSQQTIQCCKRASSTRQGRRVLPLAEPRAFVLGIFRPQIYLSEGLLSGAHLDSCEAVLEHEEAHLRRRDPLWRLIASIGRIVHLPGVAGLVGSLHARAQEMAADAEAVDRVGDRLSVAEALVRFARLRLSESPSAFEFAGSNVAARVREILEPHGRSKGPPPALLLAAGLGLFVFALASGHQLHHFSEILLGLP